MSVSNTFDNTQQLYGRRRITTHRKILGQDVNADLTEVIKILSESVKIHEENQQKESELFHIFFNSPDFLDKTKTQRSDINTKVLVPSAWSISRTLNGYCFGEPIKYVARDGSEASGKQAKVETLSEMLDFQNNHNSTVMATLSASICGLGYKLVLPADETELATMGVPFVINQDFIFPQTAFVVSSNDAIPKPVMGVYIGDYYNEEGEVEGKQYTCWTKFNQFVLKEDDDSDDGFSIVQQLSPTGEPMDAYPLTNGQIPLIEVERNAFRKGDWEVVTDLLNLKNLLISNRADDIQQIVDYILVLMNCKFENESDRQSALESRLFELKNTDPQYPPKVEILKNALEQNSIQVYADYIDLLIQEAVGIPNRQERGGGGGDTGQAVKYRNGFRDLENNAALIIPKMEKAELQFIAVCLSYAQTISAKEFGDLTDLKAYDVRCKFLRSLNDDPVASSQALMNYLRCGVAYTDAFVLAKAGTDPAELSANAKSAYENGETLIQRESQANASTETSEKSLEKTKTTGTEGGGDTPPSPNPTITNDTNS